MTTSAVQSAFAFLVSQSAFIEPVAYRTKYAHIQYPMLVPVSTEAPDWTRTITHFATDGVGEAQWFAGRATDMALADVTFQKFDVTVEMAGIGYDYSLEELNQAMYSNITLTAEKAIRARRAAEELIEKVVLEGDTTRNWDSLINAPSTKITRADAAGSGDDRYWANKDVDEIITDVNDILTGVYSDSLQVEMADTILLPISAMTLLASRRLPDQDTNLGMYIRQNNIYTQMTGMPLMIGTVRQLDNIAAGNTGRMVAYRRDPEVLRLHLPMPFMFGPAMQKGHYSWEVPGIFRTGGLEIRLPGSMRYLDAVTG